LKTTIEFLDQFAPDLWNKLDTVTELGDEKAEEILKYFLVISCQAQNMPNILHGRRAIHELPQPWLRENLARVSESTLDLTNAWEYRRLLELCDTLDGPLLKHFVAIGLASSSDEILETANDFKGAC